PDSGAIIDAAGHAVRRDRQQQHEGGDIGEYCCHLDGRLLKTRTERRITAPSPTSESAIRRRIRTPNPRKARTVPIAIVWLVPEMPCLSRAEPLSGRISLRGPEGAPSSGAVGASIAASWRHRRAGCSTRMVATTAMMAWRPTRPG